MAQTLILVVVSDKTTKTKGNTPTVAAQKAADAINKAELDSWSGHVRMVKEMDDAYQSVSAKAQKTHNRKVANKAGKSDSWVAQKNGEGKYINALLALGFTLKAIDGLTLNPSYFWKAKGINPLNAMVKAKGKGQKVELPKALTVGWLVSVKALSATAEAEQKAAVKARNEAPKGKRNRTNSKNTTPKVPASQVDKLTATPALERLRSADLPVVKHHDGCIDSLSDKELDQLIDDLGIFRKSLMDARTKRQAAKV